MEICEINLPLYIINSRYCKGICYDVFAENEYDFYPDTRLSCTEQAIVRVIENKKDTCMVVLEGEKGDKNYNQAKDEFDRLKGLFY